MKAVARAGFMAISKQATFQRRVTEAQAQIAKALVAIGGQWCVAFSGGKDSTVLLNLALAQKPDLDVIWLDDGWDYPETLQFLVDTEQRLGRSIKRVSMIASGPFWRDTPYPGDDPAYVHPADMNMAEYRKGYSAFVGVRAEESGDRRMAYRVHGPLHHSSWGQIVCWPLAEWRTLDVWAYLVSRGLAYNAAYDKLEELGVPLHFRRVGPLTAYMVWRYEAMANLRRGWPDLYNRFAQAFPNVGRWT